MSGILIVDDLVDYTQAAAALFQLSGYEVEVANSGPEAIDACRRSRPDIILLDIGMPGMSGYEVAAQLRKDYAASTPPIIAVTGFAQEADYPHSASVGIDAHLLKPVKFNELRELIDEVMARHIQQAPPALSSFAADRGFASRRHAIVCWRQLRVTRCAALKGFANRYGSSLTPN
jgi:CheY-like chemotaxis protein